MEKRGVGLSLEVVVVAALAVIVMVVLILIFTGKMGPFVKETEDCSRMNGECVPTADCQPLARAPQTCPEGQVCCVNQCLKDGGSCVSECIENDQTPENECNNKCPKEMSRIFTFGCNSGKVCCKEVSTGG